MKTMAAADHIVHRLRRILAFDQGAPDGPPVEAITCEGCDLLAIRPEGMPDYGQVDRLWRAR